MDSFQKAKKLIREAKNIYILPAKNGQPESIPVSLALFYTLRKLKKNVNPVIEKLPQRFRFLIPSLDFISFPRDFVISVQDKDNEISQVRYEKNEKNLKIYLTLDKGNLKKGDVSFSLSNFNPDVLLTLGVKDLNSYKEFFPGNPKNLSDFPILNIDNQSDNKNFAKINLTKNGFSLAEIVTNFIKSIDNNLFDKNIANCLLTGMILLTENFQNSKILPQTFETAAFLIKKGANHQEIIQNLYPVRGRGVSEKSQEKQTPLEVNESSDKHKENKPLTGQTPNRVSQSQSLKMFNPTG